MSFTSLLQVVSQREFLQVCDHMMQQVVVTRGHNNTEILLWDIWLAHGQTLAKVNFGIEAFVNDHPQCKCDVV